MYAIYIKNTLKPKHKEILLDDGCWTNKNNLNKPWFTNQKGVHFYKKPLLFNTRGGAKNYLHKYTSSQFKNRYHIEKYED